MNKIANYLLDAAIVIVGLAMTAAGGLFTASDIQQSKEEKKFLNEVQNSDGKEND